jgi:hypothetical protein
MNCPSLDEIAAFEADGSGPGAAGTASHVGACEDCRRRLLELKRLREAIADLVASRPSERQPGCPGWESLAAYVEHGPEAVDSRVPVHVQRCEYCLLQVATFSMAQNPAKRELPVLSDARPVRVEKRSWFAGWGNNWLALGFAGALATAGIVAIVVNRPPKYATIALSRPPTALPAPRYSTPPGPPAVSGPVTRPNPAKPSAGTGGPPGNPEQLLPEGPILYREIPKPDAPVTAVFRYTEGNASREVPLPLPDGLTLHSGDHFSLKVKTKSAMWVYVFQEDGRNAVSVLFPSDNFHTGANPVNSAKGRMVPAEGREFALDQATGVERIYVFYGPAAVDRCDRLVSLVESHSVDPDARRILHEMVREANASSPTAIGYAAIRFAFHHEP